ARARAASFRRRNRERGRPQDSERGKGVAQGARNRQIPRRKPHGRLGSGTLRRRLPRGAHGADRKEDRWRRTGNGSDSQACSDDRGGRFGQGPPGKSFPSKKGRGERKSKEPAGQSQNQEKACRGLRFSVQGTKAKNRLTVRTKSS